MRTIFLPVAVAVALAVAGCGGGTLNGAATSPGTATQPPTTSTSAPTTTTTTTPRTTPTPARTAPRTAPRTATTPRTTPAPAPRTTPVPNAAFAALANGVCQREDRALAAKLKQHPQAATGGDVRAAVQVLIPAEQARIAALKALTPPASVSARYGQFIAAMQDRLAKLQRLAASGSGTPRSSVLTLSGSTQRVMQLGSSIGLNCAG